MATLDVGHDAAEKPDFLQKPLALLLAFRLVQVLFETAGKATQGFYELGKGLLKALISHDLTISNSKVFFELSRDGHIPLASPLHNRSV